MRRLLISAAAVAILATPILVTQVMAQNGHRIGADAQNAPAAQPAQPAAPAAAPAAPQRGGEQGHRDNGQGGNRGGNGGPTSFSNGMPHSPGMPQTATPQNRGDQNRGDQNRGDRGANNSGRDNNGRRDYGRDYRGGENNQGRGDRGANSFAPGRDNNDQRGGYNGRDNRGYGNNNGRDGNNFGNDRRYGGSRHDFSAFRDFHRDFRASRRFRGPDYRRPAGWYDHSWTFGEFLPTAFWARDYWLNDFSDYDLPPPPYGAVWVRVANDALLVDQDSGEVITVEYGVFY